MTTLITSDLHLNDHPRDAYRHDWQAWLCESVIAHDVSDLYIIGDLTDAYDRHGSWLVNTIVGHVAALANMCRVFIIRGNHDAADPAAAFFAFLNVVPNVRFISDPAEVTDPVLGRIILLPHATDPKRDWPDLARYGVGLAHATFAGTKVGDFTLDGVPLDLIPKGMRIIAGDFHVPGAIGPVTYCGSPYTVDFGDDFKPRVLLVGAGRKMTSLPSPGRQKRLVEVDSVAQLLRVKGLASGDILKVRIRIAPEDRARWGELVAKVREWGEQDNDFVVHTVEPVSRERQQPMATKRRQLARSDDELVKDYAKARALDAATTKTGLAIVSGEQQQQGDDHGTAQ